MASSFLVYDVTSCHISFRLLILVVVFSCKRIAFSFSPLNCYLSIVIEQGKCDMEIAGGWRKKITGFSFDTAHAAQQQQG